MLKQAIFLVALVTIIYRLPAQDSLLARRQIEKLSSNKMHGRGYYKNGAIKASKYISSEIGKIGMDANGKNFVQPFSFFVNTIISNPTLKLNKQVLTPGIDYLVAADAPSNKTIFSDQGMILCINAESLSDSIIRHEIMKKIELKPTETEFKICIIDTIPDAIKKKYGKLLQDIKQHIHTIFLVKDKLTWTVSTEQANFNSFEVLRSACPDLIINNKKHNINWVSYAVKSTLKQTTQFNVIGMIKGSEKPDSTIVVCAHYDHLGRMGKASIFPGANDNAAGIAMLLDLARYYKTHQPRFTMVFIAFAGEEAGLLGSHYYVNHPWHTLNKTRFVLNLDLVGTGETGMTAVNATIFKNDFKLLDSINNANNYLREIKKRGKAANSDHYFFSELGIPSFFWYQGGPRSAYHDIYDVPETLTLYGYNSTFNLAVKFFTALGN